MEPKATLELNINGTPITIFYAEDRVAFPKGLDRDRLARISAYVCDEGFLDDDFIKLCKEVH